MKREQDKYIKVVNQVTDGIIKERERYLENELNDAEEKHTFLDNLLLEKNENGKRVISNEEIRDEVNTLMFAVSKQAKRKSCNLYIRKNMINDSIVLFPGFGHNNCISRFRFELIRNLSRHSGNNNVK